MTEAVRVRAPASSANLGAGFDCVAVALDLWNELVLRPGEKPDPAHLGVRAFGLLEDPTGFEFHFTERIPRERGLGASAATVALGLLAATTVRGEEPDLEELLALGTTLEGHSDNLAAVLAGGVCLTCDGRIARLAADVPATPIALIPEERTNTAQSRAALPDSVPHADASFTAARAALLGAGLASGSAALFAQSLEDRLHEPYRSPFLRHVREQLPREALGATLSGSGPTVIVWARTETAVACEDRLQRMYPNQSVRRLAVSPIGAELVL